MDRRGRVQQMFGGFRALIGMVHVPALPGTPGGGRSVDDMAAAAVVEARRYQDAGFHGIGIENMHDRPYLKGGVGPEIVAAMTAIGREIRRAVSLPLGVQVLAGANREALAVALATGASFVRVEGSSSPTSRTKGSSSRARASSSATAGRSAPEPSRCSRTSRRSTRPTRSPRTWTSRRRARAAEFFLADGLIVTGVASGRPPTRRRCGRSPRPWTSRCWWARGSRRNIAELRGGRRVHRRLLRQAGRPLVEPLDPEALARLVRAFKALPAP